MIIVVVLVACVVVPTINYVVVPAINYVVTKRRIGRYKFSFASQMAEMIDHRASCIG